MVTANGEVQTNEEAQVYVHDLDLFVTVQLLEDSPAVMSTGKFCEENGYSHECTDNLEDTESPVPGRASQDSDSERPTKVVPMSRKYSIDTHIPKDRNCDVCEPR